MCKRFCFVVELVTIVILAVLLSVGKTYVETPSVHIGQWTNDWIGNHKTELDAMTTLQQVFEYVKFHHPSLGWIPMPPEKTRELVFADPDSLLDLADLASYADAVTRARVDLFTEDPFDIESTKDPLDLTRVNAGSFANCAYVSLIHPSYFVRGKANSYLKLMQTHLREYMQQNKDQFPESMCRTSGWLFLSIAARHSLDELEVVKAVEAYERHLNPMTHFLRHAIVWITTNTGYDFEMNFHLPPTGKMTNPRLKVDERHGRDQ